MKYCPEYRYMDVFLAVHLLALALCVGLLQHQPQPQAVCIFMLNALFVFYLVISNSMSPVFNQHIRFPFELAEVLCNTAASFLVMLVQFDEMAASVDETVTYLLLGASFVRTTFLVLQIGPFYVQTVCKLCNVHIDSSEHIDAKHRQTSDIGLDVAV